MYTVLLALLSTIVLCAPLPSTTTTTGTTNCTPYIVKSGDTCYSIANAAGMRSWELTAMNPTVSRDCSDLQIGQSICLDPTTTPTPTSTTDSAAPPSTVQPQSPCEKYIVKSGDYCYSIAQAHGLTLPAFVAKNPTMGSCKHLQPGQEVCVEGGLTTTTSVATPFSEKVRVVSPPIVTATTPRKSIRECPADSVKVGNSCRCYVRRLTYNVKANTCDPTPTA